MSPRAGLDVVEKRKIVFLYRELKPDTVAVQSVASRYTD
jgi:hypothetical protein